MTIDTGKLSPIKQQFFPVLEKMSDADFKKVMEQVYADLVTSVSKTRRAAAGSGSMWYDKAFAGLPEEGAQRLKEEKSHESQNSDHKWIRYAEAFKKMPFTVPAVFREKADARAMYAHLADFCRKNDLPQEILADVIPELIRYIETGHMRPILFVGPKGCGKTTAVRMLIREALGIPVETIKVPEAARSHGLTGDSGIFKSADMGYLAKAQFRNNSLLVGYLIDEIDKEHEITNSASISDELLSVMDDSVSDIEDKYLEFRLVSLPHCPFFLTCNDLDAVSPILLNRCRVIRYPVASSERIRNIMRKYAGDMVSGSAYSATVEFDYDQMERSIERLVAGKVVSLREHQQVVEAVVNNAFQLALENNTGKVRVTQGMFEHAEELIGVVQPRRTGFGA